MITGPLHLARTGTSEVIIDDLHLMKSELAGVIGQTILTALAFEIMQDLAWRRLADIDNRAALQQIIVEFRVHALPPAGSTQTRWTELLLRGAADRRGRRLDRVVSLSAG
jgi:hypothetical protein